MILTLKNNDVVFHLCLVFQCCNRYYFVYMNKCQKVDSDTASTNRVNSYTIWIMNDYGSNAFRGEHIFCLMWNCIIPLIAYLFIKVSAFVTRELLLLR